MLNFLYGNPNHVIFVGGIFYFFTSIFYLWYAFRIRAWQKEYNREDMSAWVVTQIAIAITTFVFRCIYDIGDVGGYHHLRFSRMTLYWLDMVNSSLGIMGTLLFLRVLKVLLEAANPAKANPAVWPPPPSASAYSDL